MDILKRVEELQDLFDEDEVTTADKINRPEPKQSVKEIELFNEFNIRNPKAGGGMLVQPSVDGSRPGYAKPKQKFTTPKGYVTAAELAEELGLSAATLKKYRTKGATVDKYPLKGFIEKTFKPFKGKSSATGTSTYYLKPTKKMLNDYQNFKNRTTISRDLLKDVEKLHNSELIKNLKKSKKKVLPTLDQVVEVLGKDVKAHGRAANAMSVLSKMYQGEEYRLLKLPKNEETGKFIFKALRKGGKFNPYKAAFYNLAIEEIDKTLGNEVGTLKNFKRYFKDNLTKYLGKGHGVSLNEVASISGMVSNNMAPYGAFVDLTNSKINKGLLANFQGTLTNALTEIDKLKGREKLQAINAFNKNQIPNFKKQIADKYGKKLADNIRFTEIVPGTKLTNTYKPEDLARYKTQGIDLQSLAKTKGYYLDVKGAKPYTEFLENKKLTKSGKTSAMRSLKADNVKGLVPFMKKLGIKCQLSEGINCMNPKAYEKSLNQISKAAQAGDSAAQSKLLNFRKAVRGAGSVIKGVLGPAAIAAEIGIAIPIGLFDYAQGKPTEEIVNTLTYGLAGKSRQDRLKEQMPTYGQGDKLQTAFDTYLSTLNKQGLPRDPNELRPGIKTSQAINRFNKAREPFIRPNPQVEEGGFFDLDMFNRNVSESRALEQKLAEEDLKRQEQRKTPFDLSDPFMAADGGLSGGDKSGPPPESGPTPHGLPGILKRVKNI